MRALQRLAVIVSYVWCRGLQVYHSARHCQSELVVGTSPLETAFAPFCGLYPTQVALVVISLGSISS